MRYRVTKLPFLLAKGNRIQLTDKKREGGKYSLKKADLFNTNINNNSEKAKLLFSIFYQVPKVWEKVMFVSEFKKIKNKQYGKLNENLEKIGKNQTGASH